MAVRTYKKRCGGGIKSTLANTAGGFSANLIGNAYGEPGRLNYLTHKLTHGLVGGLTGALLDKDKAEGALSGAIGSIVGEVVMEALAQDPFTLLQQAQHQAKSEGQPFDYGAFEKHYKTHLSRQANLARFIAASVAFALDQDVNVASTTAATAIENNSMPLLLGRLNDVARALHITTAFLIGASCIKRLDHSPNDAEQQDLEGGSAIIEGEYGLGEGMNHEKQTVTPEQLLRYEEGGSIIESFPDHSAFHKPWAESFPAQQENKGANILHTPATAPYVSTDCGFEPAPLRFPLLEGFPVWEGGYPFSVLMQESEHLTKTYQTYIKINPNTGQIYVGRTSGYYSPEKNIAIRDRNHHMNEQGFGPAILDEFSTSREAIRGWEQIMIEESGRSQSEGGVSGNKINSIAKDNPNREKYIQQALNEFRKK